MTEEQGNAARPDIEDAAIDWWLRQNDGRPLSKRERAAFEAWVSQDKSHKAAFNEVAGMFGHMAERWPGAGPIRKRRRSKRKAAVAAIVVSVLAFAIYSDAALYLKADHYAGVGDTKQITLEDGSHLELNSKSAIAIHFSTGQRRLTLLEGEAWFEVAPDTARPFVVEAAGGTVTALGTAFDVAVENRQTRVTVTQHRVMIASGGGQVVVDEGQQSAYSRSMAAQGPQSVDVDRITAWRQGKLMFEDRPLGEVVEALSRYHRSYVFFANPALRSRHVTGVFRTDDPLAALDEIEITLGLHTIRLTNYLIFISE